MRFAVPNALLDDLHPYRCDVWRSRRSISSGRPTETWRRVATGVPVYLESKPSQFTQVGGGVQSEGDNLFTQDWLHFKPDADIEPYDVVKFTSTVNGQSDTEFAVLKGAYWRIRGDLQPHVWRASKKIFLSIRLATPPNGVS